MANIKSAQQLLNDLPKTDALEVLDEIGHWIEALFDPSNGFRLDHQFAVLRMLDDAAHPHLRKITQSYFAVVPPALLQENRLWGAINSYSTFCDLGYLDLLIGMQQGEKGKSGIKSSTGLICARGIYAVFGKLECMAVRYMQPDPQLWKHLAEFYAFAEAEQCLDEPVSLYAGMGANTVRHLFGCGVMWYTSAAGSLRPLDLHIAKRLISHFSKSFTIGEQCREDSLFTFDLANPSPPARVKESGTMYPPSIRFVGSGGAPGQLGNISKTLDKGLVPEELNMGVAYSAETVADVAQHLTVCCNFPLPSRRHQRRKIKMRINVLDGFFNMVEQTNVDVNLNDHLSENWEVEDISANGLSCVLPAGQASTVKIGTLIGLQPGKSLHWGAGIVRRLSRDGQNNLHVGVKILANKVECVVLRDKGSINNTEQRALFLDRPEEQGGESWILMKSDTFTSSYSPTMKLGGQSFLMLPLGLEEKGVDFDIVRYRKMAKDHSGDETY